MALRFTAPSMRLARPRPVIVPVGEHGWLTPIRATAGSAAHYIWKCRCGADVVRPAKDVRKSVKLGRTPACDSCARMLRSEAAMRKEA
jgi:hypothetical protein